MLEVSGITKSFGGLKAVDSASLDVQAGEIVALIGPNGAGKTTLFAILAGFHQPDAGRTVFDGRDIAGLPPHQICAAGMVRTFQITQPFARITVRENIMVGAYLRIDDRSKARDRAEAVAAQVGMAAQLDRLGADLTVAGHSEVFALGDMALAHRADGSPAPLPGLAPVAMQQGSYAAEAIQARLRGHDPRPFHYRDKGNLATIGRARAVADIKGLQLSGLPAWLIWLVVHLFYLIGFQNRVVVVLRWSFSFLTKGRGARLITVELPVAREARADGPSETELIVARR